MPAPTISTGRPTSRRLRAHRCASASAARPTASVVSESSHAATHSDWSGIRPLASRPIAATAIAATDTALTAGASPSSISARSRVR